MHSSCWVEGASSVSSSSRVAMAGAIEPRASAAPAMTASMRILRLDTGGSPCKHGNRGSWDCNWEGGGNSRCRSQLAGDAFQPR